VEIELTELELKTLKAKVKAYVERAAQRDEATRDAQRLWDEANGAVYQTLELRGYAPEVARLAKTNYDVPTDRLTITLDGEGPTELQLLPKSPPPSLAPRRKRAATNPES
jgi:hypothetical protein